MAMDKRERDGSLTSRANRAGACRRWFSAWRGGSCRGDAGVGREHARGCAGNPAMTSGIVDARDESMARKALRVCAILSGLLYASLDVTCGCAS